MALVKASPGNPPLALDEENDNKSGQDPRLLSNGNEKESKKKTKPCTDFSDDSEHADLAEKIFQNINGTFEKDELIDEFDIIPVESKTNCSPVLHEETEHKLALESWAVPYLYTHSYKSFLAVKRKQKCSPLISNDGSSCSSKYGSLKASQLTEADRVGRGVLLSRTLVLLNPDLVVAWNFRREFVPMAERENLEEELRLINLVATRKPKCPEGFYYRRWLVENALDRHLISFDTISDWFLNETAAIETPISRYYSNYHAWSYRLWLLQKIMNHRKIPSDQKELVMQAELCYSEKWMNTHVSDYCGHHYRQKLLHLLIITKNDFGPDSLTISKLKKELDENAQRIEVYEGHECLWSHRRIVLLLMTHLLTDDKIGATFTLGDILDNEKKFISQFWENFKDKKCVALKEDTKPNAHYCKQYILWIRRHLGVDLSFE